MKTSLRGASSLTRSDAAWQLYNAAAWYLEERTTDAWEALAGAVSRYEHEACAPRSGADNTPNQENQT